MMASTLAMSFFCLVLALFLYYFRDLRRVLQTWKFLLKGRAIMLEHTQKNPRKPFSLAIPGNLLHVTCSEEHWNDLNKAPTSQLSPNAASREMFQPKYTFGFDWAAPREHVSLATVRSIRNMTQQLPSFQKRFVAILDDEFNKALSKSPQIEGWARVTFWTTVRRAVTRINSLIFLGEDIADDEDFITRGLSFVDQTSVILESVRLVPSFLAPLVTKLIKGRGRDSEYVFRIMRALVAKRESYKATTSESSLKKPNTILEGIIDYCQDDRSTQQNVDTIITTWVISTLAIPVVACQLLQVLYTQTDHFEPLRKECQSVPLHDSGRSQYISDEMEKLQLLEAFTMESWRTRCFQSNTVHRVAMKPFQFSDGYKVNAGEAVEFHQNGLMNDESLYPNPIEFDPSRFINKNKSLVDTGLEWPFWGVPRLICPGRWHVSNVQKLLAVYMMQNFEAKLESTKNLNFEWRDAPVPNQKNILLLKRRTK
ncbi:cytochrome P450 [Corynespora cassiicola Philippines]|uniref:Cytochrome P450 n=1 Tax=Corynespora cassiicola Philippines TaxID=1448308 RepID=A0A2T2NAC3_CORCC|nr:cytochrome P450 [Corynespora cassiicola Philippines]